MAKITEKEGHEHLPHVPANVWAAFFILMSLTTSIGFIYSWSAIDLFLAAVFNVVATLIKYRIKEKNVLGEISLGASIVADLHLIPACVLVVATGIYTTQLPVETSFAAKGAIGFAIGAVIANIVSVAIVVINESLQFEYLRKYKRVKTK